MVWERRFLKSASCMHDWELTPEVMVAVKVDITVPGRVVYVYDAHDPVGEEQHSPRQHSSESSPVFFSQSSVRGEIESRSWFRYNCRPQSCLPSSPPTYALPSAPLSRSATAPL